MAIARLVIRRGEKEANRSASCAFTVGIGDACIRVLIELMIDHARQVKHVLYFYYISANFGHIYVYPWGSWRRGTTRALINSLL